MKFDRLWAPDPGGAASGGGAAPAAGDAGAAGATPPAGTPPVETPAPFDWNAPLPDNLPPQFEKLKGKKFEDVAKSYKELQAQWTKDKQELDKLRGTPPSNPALLTGEEWGGYVKNYYDSGQVDDETVTKLSERIGLPSRDIKDFFDHLGAKRSNFLTKTQEVLGPDIKFQDIEKWIESGKSPFSQEAVVGFNELSQMGDVSWLKIAAGKYVEWANQNPNNPTAERMKLPPSNQAPPLRGSAPTGQSSQSGTGFTSAMEYFQACQAANQHPHQHLAKQAVLEKLKLTDPKVRQEIRGQ